MNPRARKAAVAAAVVAAVLLAAAAARPIWRRSKPLLKRLAGYPALVARSGAKERPWFVHLATSQVGYPPAVRKEFTSPRAFPAFSVVTEPGRRVVFRGGPPVREMKTDLLGALATAFVGDFTAVDSPGRYRVVTDDGLSSLPFDVGSRVFDPAIRAVLRTFYFQRAFTAVEAAHAEGPWVHPSDAGLAPPAVTGGWHDAGDLSIYSLSTASTLFWLLQAWSDFAPAADDTNIPESGNGVPDLLDEIRWGLGWLLSVQDASGGFRNTTCQEGYARYGTNRPEAMPPYRDGEVGTLATARAVGTLAYAASVFGPRDPVFAARCLEAARRGQRYLDARPGDDGDGPTCPAFRQDGDARAGRDVRMYAAAGLLLATGEPRFARDFEASFQPLESDASGYRPNFYGALLYLRAPSGDQARKTALREALRVHAAAARRDAGTHPFRWATRYFWGSIAAGFHRTAASSAQVCLEERGAAVDDCEQVLANVHYAFGRNSMNLAYVSGLPGVTHGRMHAFHHWLAALRAEPFLFPGLVAGGPTAAPPTTDLSYPHARPPVWGYFGDPAMPRDGGTPLDGRYTDNDSWSTNELDIDWQAVTLYNLLLARWWSTQQEERNVRPASAGSAP